MADELRSAVKKAQKRSRRGMNRKQRAVILIGIWVIALMLLAPPWDRVSFPPRMPYAQRRAMRIEGLPTPTPDSAAYPRRAYG